MIRSALLIAALLFCACPKSTTVNVSGTDDEQLDQLSAQLEELKTRQDLSCADNCAAKTRVTGLSTATCDLANKHTDRPEFQAKCVTAQEELARFSDACASCSK